MDNRNTELEAALKKQLEQIRDERMEHANTASRIGNALLSLLSCIGSSAATAFNSFLRRDADDTASGHITFEKGLTSSSSTDLHAGATFGDYTEGESGGAVNAAGDADMKSLSVRDGVHSSDWRSGESGFCAQIRANGRSYAEVDELFVRMKVVFNELEIRKLSYVGGNIELSAAGSHIHSVDRIIGPRGGNLIPNSDFPSLSDEHFTLGSGKQLVPQRGYNELRIEETGLSQSMYYGAFYNLAADPGQQYTISFYYHGEFDYGAALEVAAAREQGGAVYYKFPIGGPGNNKLELEACEEDRRIVQTITMPGSCSGLIVKIWLRRNGVMYISRPRIEMGATAQAWEGVTTARYRCYLMRDDGTTATRNWWRVGDLAKCQTSNIAQRNDNGVWKDAANRYYWRAVVGVGEEMLNDGRTYDYVELANTSTVWLEDSAGVLRSFSGYDTTFESAATEDHRRVNDAPLAGDDIVQEGHLFDPDRQHLIRLCVIGKSAPSIEEYSGVNGFRLTGHLKTQLSPRAGDIFVAKRFEIETESGGSYRVPCDRGAYVDGERYFYYDRVSYNGALWLCIGKNGNLVGNVIVPPSESAASVWQKQVDRGSSFNIVVTGGEVIFNGPGAKRRVYVEVYDGEERLTYDHKTGFSCGVLSEGDRICDNHVYWTFGTDGDGKRFYYELICAPGDFEPTEVPFVVMDMRGGKQKEYQRVLHVSTANSAITVTLSPETVILTQSPDNGTIDLQPAYTNVKVYKGVTDVTSDAEIGIAEADGCEAGTPTHGAIAISSLVGNPEHGCVVINAKYKGVTMQKTFSFAVNYLGKFKETIENDIKRQVASKSFSYIDENGDQCTQTGLSEIVQSANEIAMAVYGDNNGTNYFGHLTSMLILQSSNIKTVNVSSDFVGSNPTKIIFQCDISAYGTINGTVDFVFTVDGVAVKTITSEITTTDELFPVSGHFVIDRDVDTANFMLTVKNNCSGIIYIRTLRLYKVDSVKNGLTKTGIDITNGLITLTARNTIINSDVAVRSLETIPTEGGAYAKMSGSTLEFFGLNSTPSIKVGVDDDGNAVFIFYDSAGNATYNLGPGGLSQIINTSTNDMWSDAVNMIAIADGDNARNAIGDIPGVTEVTDPKVPHYMYNEGYFISESGEKVFAHGGGYNRKWYDTDAQIAIGDSGFIPAGEDNVIIDGWYAGEVSFNTPTDKQGAPRYAEVTIRKFVGGRCVQVNRLEFEITYIFKSVNGSWTPTVDLITPATITLPASLDD